MPLKSSWESDDAQTAEISAKSTSKHHSTALDELLFFPFIRDLYAESSHHLPVSESKLLSKCRYNGAIVIIHLTSELGLISRFPVCSFTAERD